MKKITYGFYNSLFGEMVLAKTSKGLCWLGFMVQGYKGDGHSRMKAFFPRAEFVQDNAVIKDLAEQVLQAWKEDRMDEIPLDLEGTTFQKAVWNALLKIPKGKVWSYTDVANDIDNPKAVRAVGTAVGSNPVSLIVPCHRVVPAAGGIGNYGWGPKLKEKLLAAESKA